MPLLAFSLHWAEMNMTASHEPLLRSDPSVHFLTPHTLAKLSPDGTVQLSPRVKSARHRRNSTFSAAHCVESLCSLFAVFTGLCLHLPSDIGWVEKMYKSFFFFTANHQRLTTAQLRGLQPSPAVTCECYSLFVRVWEEEKNTSPGCRYESPHDMHPGWW